MAEVAEITEQIKTLINGIKETEQMVDLIVRIENIWREYRNLQDQYRKLTGRDYEWLR
jgi:vacuolar-type H+-ATPase subunit D/Vma8